MRRAMAHDFAARVRDGSRGRGLALSPRPLYPPKAEGAAPWSESLNRFPQSSVSGPKQRKIAAESRSIQALSDLSCEITGRLCLAGWTP